MFAGIIFFQAAKRRIEATIENHEVLTSANKDVVGQRLVEIWQKVFTSLRGDQRHRAIPTSIGDFVRIYKGCTCASAGEVPCSRPF